MKSYFYINEIRGGRRMTLDEAIKHAEEVAEEKRCEKCGEEHRQLAEWLKELKQLRKQESCDDIELPNGATNGDMIKTMFPNIEIEGIGGEIKCIATQNGTSYFALDWWNAPYKKVGKGKRMDENEYTLKYADEDTMMSAT